MSPGILFVFLINIVCNLLKRFQGVEKSADQGERSASVVATASPTATTITSVETTEKRRRGKHLLNYFENDAIYEY